MIALFLGVITTGVIVTSGDEDFNYKLTQNIVNDVTQLNPISVNRVIKPKTFDQIIAAIKTSSGPVSIGGGRYSQGGQIGYEDSLHIDMREFNKIVSFNKESKEVTVQAGITWRQLQEFIDTKNLSIRIMQTYANFTVGGSLSVNVHGRYIGEGPLVHSVKSIKLILADGSSRLATPTQNSELFYGAIGGYGGLGVIAEATLSLTDNIKVERKVKKMKLGEYSKHFAKNIRNNSDIIFHNADIYPPSYENALDVSWYKTDKKLTKEDRLISTTEKYPLGPKLAEFAANYTIGKHIRQYIFDPIYYSFDRVVWRNWEASYDVRELEPKSRKDKTYVLREYFIPVEKFDSFAKQMSAIFKENDANIINVSVRHAHKDPNTLLSWARNEMFAFVVYYQQGTDRDAITEVKKWSTEMIDAVVQVGGSYYLPYQIFATPEQFLATYPNSPKFFELKAKVDPNYRFRNKLWLQHYPAEIITAAEKTTIKNYFHGEEQTFLTIPEWYLVFNPKEYVEFLEQGSNPSDFPFFKSVDEYWTLYDRVKSVVKDRYPENSGYMLMLNVIGISTSVEYVAKGLYEQSIGRLTRWIANNKDTHEDRLITKAHRAYSELIFHKAWYEFDFWSHVNKIWSEPIFFEKNFIRKLERKLFFSMEFGFKTLYAKAIKYGAENTYELSDGLVYLTAKIPDAIKSQLPEGVTLLLDKGELQIISLPRWGKFTEIIPMLAEQGVLFKDISGNDDLALSFTSSGKGLIEFPDVQEMFSSPYVSNDNKKRSYIRTKVSKLHLLLNFASENGYELEHIYDY